MIGPKRKPVHPVSDWRRQLYLERFALGYYNPTRELTQTELDQLDRCKDDESRRILLGIGERFEEGERP